MSVRNGRIIIFAMAVFAALLLGAAGASFFREYGRDYFVSHEKMPSPDKKTVLKWHGSVRKGDILKSLLLAAALTPDDRISLPDPDYLKLLNPLKLNSLILTDSFNSLDYYRWKDTLELKELAASIAKDNPSPAVAIYNAVAGNVKIRNDYESTCPAFSVMEIWKNKSGSPLDRIRLFCGLSEQAGLDVMVVGLLGKTGRLEHILCETRSGNNSADLFDFAFEKAFPGMSLAELAKKPSAIPEQWPPSIRKSLQRKFVYMQPSEFQDYRLSNQKLASRLGKALLPQLPVFGKNPKEALEKYIDKAGIERDNFFGYWQYPLLAVKSLPEFPERWAKEEKQE